MKKSRNETPIRVMKSGPNTATQKTFSHHGVGKNTRAPSPSHTHPKGGAVLSPRGASSPMDTRGSTPRLRGHRAWPT